MGAIQIKELHIKINVDEGATKKSDSAGGPPKVNKEAIIAECVEQVMEIIEKQSER